MRPLPTLLALVAAAAFGGLAATALHLAVQPPAGAQPAGPAGELPPPFVTAASEVTVAGLPAAVEGQPLPSLAPMFERVTPAVVSVHTRQRVRARSPFGDDPFFRRMFPELS